MIMTDAQFSKPNGWMGQVWFPTQKMHGVRVINPGGRPIPLAGPRQFELGGLNEPKVAELLVRLGQLLPTDSDAEAVAKIRQ
jgi:hypothetical protein